MEISFKKNIAAMELHYKHISVDKYVIMPNHIHAIIVLSEPENGVPRSSRPAALVPSIITAFKKFTTKEMAINIWQKSFHDYIIRTEKDYQNIWQYIDENPIKWS